MIIVMTDGSSKGNPGPVKLGVIIWDRNKNPRVIKPTYRFSQFHGYGTNNEAEWQAIIHAMKFLKDKYSNETIYFYSDSQLVINQINGLWKVKHDSCKELFTEYSNMLIALNSKGNELHFSWIPRQLIYLADKEASQE